MQRYQVLKADRWKSENPHSTWLRGVRGHRPCNRKVRKTYHMLWSAVFEMKSEDWGRVLACVTAGVVLLWRTRRSALPLWLVINGHRFITSSQTAMLPGRPTLLVTQSDWLMRTQKHTYSLHKPVQHESKRLQLFRHCYDLYSGFTDVLSLCLLPLVLSIQRTSLSSTGKTRRTLSSTACLPLQGMYLCKAENMGIYCSSFKWQSVICARLFKCMMVVGKHRECLEFPLGGEFSFFHRLLIVKFKCVESLVFD